MSSTPCHVSVCILFHLTVICLCLFLITICARLCVCACVCSVDGYRMFVGNLGGEATDAILSRCFQHYKSFQMVRFDDNGDNAHAMFNYLVMQVIVHVCACICTLQLSLSRRRSPCYPSLHFSTLPFHLISSSSRRRVWWPSAASRTSAMASCRSQTRSRWHAP